MKVVVVGAHGQLGAAVVQELAAAHQVLALGHEDLDVTSDRDVAAAMAMRRPDAIVNCAAFNDVDGAEERPVDALNLNAFAVRALARAAADLDAILVHYGTDFVFDGKASEPYARRRPSQSAQRVRRVEAAGRMVCGERAEGVCVARREPLRPGPRRSTGERQRRRHPRHAHRRWRAARLRGSNRVADLYHRRGGGDAAAHRNRGAVRAVPLRQLGHCTWLEFAQELARQLGDGRPVRADAHGGRIVAAPSGPQFCALANDKLRVRRDFDADLARRPGAVPSHRPRRSRSPCCQPLDKPSSPATRSRPHGRVRDSDGPA